MSILPCLPTYLLLITSDTAILWRRRGRDIKQIGSYTFSIASISFWTQVLKPTGRKPILVLLATPDLVIKQDDLPKASIFDKRKIIRRQQEMHFPVADILGQWAIGHHQQELVSLHASPFYQQLCRALATKKYQLAHIALESAHAFSTGHNKSLILLILGSHIMLLGTSDGKIDAFRIWPANHTSISHEIDRTCRYLQRHGWSQKTPIELHSFGIEPGTLAWPQIKTISYTAEAGWGHLLGALFTKGAKRILRSSWLAKRRQRQRFLFTSYTASFSTLALAILLWTSALYQHQQRGFANAQLESQISTLPPPLPVTDPTAVRLLQLTQELKPTIIRLSLLPIQSFRLTSSTFLREQPVSLNLQTLPIKEENMFQIPGWKSETYTEARQGDLTDEAEAKPQTRRYQWEPRP